MSLAWEIATQIAPPIMTEAMICWVLPSPLAMTVSRVTAIRVMPERGDQFVRPTHSETITPATQTQRMPSRAIMTPVPRVMSGTVNWHRTIRSSPPPTTPV